MENLFEAIVLEAGFTAFWQGCPIETAMRIFAWDGILAELYRRTFVENAPRARAILYLLKEAA